MHFFEVGTAHNPKYIENGYELVRGLPEEGDNVAWALRVNYLWEDR